MGSDWTARHYWQLLTALFLAALALRVGTAARFVGLSAEPSYSAQPDQIDYERIAHHLCTGEGYCLDPGKPTASRPPGTSLALLPVYLVAGRSYAAGRLWFALLSAATCLATAWAARQALPPRTALLAAAFVAFYPGHFYYAMHFLSEVPVTLFTMLAVGCTLRSLRRPLVAIDVLGGACWAAAVMARPQMALVVPLGLLAALARSEVRRLVAGQMLGLAL